LVGCHYSFTTEAAEAWYLLNVVCVLAGAIGSETGTVIRRSNSLTKDFVTNLALLKGPWCPRFNVFLTEIGFGRTPLQIRKNRTWGQASGSEQKASVTNHAVIRANSQAFNVPAANHGFGCDGVSE
jgi:hypothetical protein